MGKADADFAELLKSTMQFDVDIGTSLIVVMGVYTSLLLLIWVFTGSHVAMAAFLAFACINIRAINRVNVLQERILNCDFTDALSISTQQVVRWAYAVTVRPENCPALSSEQKR